MIIGLTGMPTVGKDTFFNYMQTWLLNYNDINLKIPTRASFADSVRDDLKDFIHKQYNIDVYNCSGEEKELIRPIMIAHGVLKRRDNPNHFIEILNKKLKNNFTYDMIPVITDVRYVNEVKYVQESGGIMIHLTRDAIFPPVDSDEMLECFELCDYFFELNNIKFTDNESEDEKKYVNHHNKCYENLLDDKLFTME